MFRVFPRVKGARSGQPGHALYTPPIQGAGRIDNPERYRVLYAATTPEAAVGERFGHLIRWSDRMFLTPRLPDAVISLAELRADIKVLDLDDPDELALRVLRPSRVATRNRAVTQAWALRLFEEQRWSGVGWWSVYDADWSSMGIWAPGTIKVAGVTPLAVGHAAVVQAARVLGRPLA